MIGAIAGDVIGSLYERYGIKTKDFPLFDWRCRFTDDTVLTVAVADALTTGGNYVAALQSYYRRYPDAGYGGSFHIWGRSSTPQPYGSFGNGSAMRVSPVAYAFDDMHAVLAEAKRSAEVTHDHPEGIRGAQATAAAVFLARRQTVKSGIQSYLEQEFHYDLSKTLDSVRPGHKFDVTCQGTVPIAVRAFLEAEDYEDAIRNAVSMGGDSDTLACIAGSIAGAYYGVPSFIESEVRDRLDDRLRRVVDLFEQRYGTR